MVVKSGLIFQRSQPPRSQRYVYIFLVYIGKESYHSGGSFFWHFSFNGLFLVLADAAREVRRQGLFRDSEDSSGAGEGRHYSSRTDAFPAEIDSQSTGDLDSLLSFVNV